MKKGVEKSNSCDGKIIYYSLSEAGHAAKLLNIKGGNKNRLISYKCGFCSGYHFGHENKKNKTVKLKRDKKKLDPKDFAGLLVNINKGFCMVKQIA